MRVTLKQDKQYNNNMGMGNTQLLMKNIKILTLANLFTPGIKAEALLSIKQLLTSSPIFSPIFPPSYCLNTKSYHRHSYYILWPQRTERRWRENVWTSLAVEIGGEGIVVTS